MGLNILKLRLCRTACLSVTALLIMFIYCHDMFYYSLYVLLLISLNIHHWLGLGDVWLMKYQRILLILIYN